MGVIEDVFPLQPLQDNISKVNILPLVNVTLEDAGEYICTAKNSAGRTHNSAWVEVLTGGSFKAFLHNKWTDTTIIDRLMNKGFFFPL